MSDRDEGTRAVRGIAFVIGFWLVLAAAVLVIWWAFTGHGQADGRVIAGFALAVTGATIGGKR